jgi:zinc protease
MKLKLLTLVLLSVSLSCATLPRPGKPNMPDVQFRMRDFRLANGMRIIVEEDHASPLVGIFTNVGVGSSGDPAGREGLAHLIEHLAFRSKPTGKMSSWNQLEFAGVGTLNAYTSFDNTMYYEIGSKDLLQKLLSIESARLLNPMAGVDQQTFDVEREVVRNELRQRGENAVGPAMTYLQEAVFPPSHHYFRPVGGSHESLSAITLDDAKKFVKDNYKASNMTMLILGDVDLATVQDQLVRALPMSVFQPLPPTKDPYPSRMLPTAPALPPLPEARLIKRHSTVATPELYVVWSLPRSMDSESVLMDFVRAAASRELSQAFRSDPDIVNVSVFPIQGLEASMLVAQATLRKGDHVEKSYERIKDQLVKLWASGEAGREYSGGDEARATVEADQEFGRMRNNTVMEMTMAAENLQSRGSERVVATHFTGDPLVFTRNLKALADVTPGQVSHFSEQYLTRDRARAVLVEPYEANSKDATPGTAGLAPAAADAVANVGPEAIKELGRAALAHNNETVVRAGRDHIVETLPSGMKVIIHRRRNSLPVAVVELTFTAGGATSTGGAAELGMQLARPKGHAYGRGDDFGIDWNMNVRADRSTIVGEGASGNLPNMLAQLSERLNTIAVDPMMMDFWKREYADYLERTEQVPVSRGERSLREKLFEGHPFGKTALVADEKNLSGGDIEKWFDKAWSAKNAVLTVTGDFESEKTLELVKQWMGSWKGAETPLSTPPFKPATHEKATIVITNQPGATQAQLHMACLADGSKPIDELSSRTIANLLGTALFQKIRGELGASYGINGRAQTMLGGTARIDWQGSIENSRLPQALTVIFTMMKGFEKDTLTDVAIGRARWEVAREATMEGATAGTVAAVMTNEVLMGRTPEETANMFEALAGVGRPQLEATWKACSGTTVVSLVGDEARIHESLKAAGME